MAANAIEEVDKQQKSVAQQVADALSETARTSTLMNANVDASNHLLNELKLAKRQFDRCTTRAEETEREETNATDRITRTEEKLASRMAQSSDCARKAAVLREQEEECAQAVETALTAAAEFEGQGGPWELRTQKTLKERETEHKQTATLSKKANQAEMAAEQAADEAAMKLEEAKNDLEVKKRQAVDAKADLAEATKALAGLSIESEAAEALAEAAKAEFEVADKVLKNARAAEAKMAHVSVKRCEELAIEA